MTSIDADLLKESFVKASHHLEKNHRILNNLNVFPVPDGDTGSNMSSSLKARFFAGFFAELADAGENQNAISSAGLGDRFSQGSFLVNTSLFSPTEGTMITIIAAMSEYMRTVADVDIRTIFSGALSAARAALENTPRELPVLAKAGVIDSGALGFILLFDGFLSGLTGVEPVEEKEDDYRFPPEKPSASEEMNTISFRFCTEILVRTDQEIPPEDLRIFLRERGNSIALVNESELLKLHIHTNDPDEIIEYLSKFGVIEKTKIEDMQDQVNLFNKKAEATDNAVLVCVPGDGFTVIFRNLGAEYALSYDEKLPSAREISEALHRINNEHIIIITNNKNIIPAAIMARESCEKAVSILPTESVAKGIAAMYGFSENDTIAENARNMNDCLEFVQSFSLFESSMDSRFGDVDIRRGDFFSLSSGDILAVGPSREGVIQESFKHFDLALLSNISFFTGLSFDSSCMKNVLSFLIDQNESLEIETLFGGQSREDLIVSLE
jgi:DAK2 domain fusion protein YloV